MTDTITEKPILFKTEMIQAILHGRKTQTRRVIKNAPDVMLDIQQAGDLLDYPEPDQAMEMLEHAYGIKCRYNADELWARETYALHKSMNTQPPSKVPEQLHDPIFFKARNDHGLSYNQEIMGKWRPSIHIPRWASRIQLEVIEISVERVQDISEEDAIAEGITCWICNGPVDGTSENDCGCFHSKKEAIPSFEVLWDSINAKPKPAKSGGEITHYESYPWEDIQETMQYRGKPWYVWGNPWVWVVKFKVKEIKS